VGFTGSPDPIYVRGAAFLMAHQGTEAAIEFQKILDHRGLPRNAMSVHLVRRSDRRPFTGLTSPLTPTTILDGRLVKFGAQVEF
jgi:hypothetical protein